MAKVAKVPVIMQMEAQECGAASLCMILAYYGKWIPLEKMRIDCGVSRDGSNAKNIVKAARNYGLKANGYKLEPSKLDKISLPAIIHWDFNHFVVFNGFRKDKAVINDPARGRVEVTLDEFDKSFTGIVLCFEKTENFIQGGKPRNIWTFTSERLKGTGAAFAFVAVTGVLTACLGLVTPIFSRIFLDYIVSGTNPEWLNPLIGAMSLTLVLQFIIGVIQGIYWLKIQGMLSVESNASFMWHVLRLPVQFFSQRYIGDIVSRQSLNESISATMISKLAPILMNVALIILYFGIMLNYSVLLSSVALAAALANIIILRIVSNKRVNMSRVIQRDIGKLNGVTMSGLEMIETIKASGAEVGFFQRWAGYFTKQNNGQAEFNRANQFYGAVPSLMSQTADIGVLIIGVYLILEGRFTIGMLFAFQGFLNSFLSPLSELSKAGQSFIEMRSSMERIEDIFNYKTDVLYDDDKDSLFSESKKLSGLVEINNLTFGYNRLDKPLINNFSLKLKRGGSVALVGGSGSGKSSLVKVISGLYEPWSGEILFDGERKKEINHTIFTSSVSVVDQDVILFEDTIMNNITMWDKSIDKSYVVSSCKDAQIHEDIMARDGGYDHFIKEGGKNFSGGQSQRFEIARALAANPSILILDEATSALDVKTEKKIMDAIKTRGITLIIVAHRLSTIRDCDEIIVLDKGCVSERGTHEELASMSGKYSQLINN